LIRFPKNLRNCFFEIVPYGTGYSSEKPEILESDFTIESIWPNAGSFSRFGAAKSSEIAASESRKAEILREIKERVFFLKTLAYCEPGWSLFIAY
jgi:hypothetical protein